MLSFILATLLLSHSILASENVQMSGTSREIEFSVQYSVKGSSGEQHIVDVFTVKPGELQELKERLIFPDKKTMEQQFILHQKRPLSVKPFEFVATEVNRSLWAPQNKWSHQWEENYNDWVDKNFDENYFVEKNLATDCADAAILLRWIFARIHSLPMASTLAGGGVVFSHKSMKKKWLNLPTHSEWEKDKRFLAVLNYLADNTYTHTLFKDTYPVKLDTATIRTGTILLELHGSSGHTRLIGETNYTDPSKIPLELFSSTVPRQVRKLFRESFLGIQPPVRGQSGLRQILWPVYRGGKWRVQKQKDGLFFSEDQFDETLAQGDFSLNLYRYLGLKFNPMNIAMDALDDLASTVEQRIKVVEDGYIFCQSNDCSPGTQNWEDWSTPSRDGRLLKKFHTVNYITDRLSALDPSIPAAVQKGLNKTLWTIGATDLSLNYIQTVFGSHIVSSDPRVSVAQRWALNGLAVAQNIKVSLQDKMNVRESKILKNSSSCRTNCLPGSQSFMEHNTGQIDSEIRNLLYVDERLCLTLPTMCVEATSALQQMSVFVLGQSQQITNLKEDFIYYSSDPNVSPAERWNKSLKVESVVFRDNNKISVSHNHLWTMEGLKSTVKNLKTGKSVASSQIVQVIPKPNGSLYPFWGFGQNNEIYLFDSNTFDWTPIESSILSVGLTNPRIVSSNFLLFDGASTQTSSLVEIDFSKLKVASEKSIKVLSETNYEGMVSLAGVQGSDLKLWLDDLGTLKTVNLPNEYTKTQNITISRETDNIIRLRVVDHEQIKTVFLNLKTNQKLVLKDTLNAQVSEKQKLIIIPGNSMDTYKIYEFDTDQLKVKKIIRSGQGWASFVKNDDGLSYISVMTPASGSLFSYSGGQLRAIRGPSGSVFMDVSGRYSLWFNKTTRNVYLRDETTMSTRGVGVIDGNFIINFHDSNGEVKNSRVKIAAFSIDFEAGRIPESLSGFVYDVATILESPEPMRVEQITQLRQLWMGGELPARFDRGQVYQISLGTRLWLDPSHR